MSHTPAKRLALLAAAVALLCSCGPRPAAAVDYWPAQAWRTSSPEQQGLDSDLLAGMMDAILREDHAVDSVTVIRHGYIVADATVCPFEPNTKHVIYSCTKSIVSALVGIAIDRGAIEGIDLPLLSVWPERTVANRDADKEALTIEHLLTMSTGLDCRDSYLYSWQGLQEMQRTDDWVQYMLDLPMVARPGQRFEYCNGDSYLLSAIVQEKTGQSALDYATEYLFGPLGITDVEWLASPQGISIGWSRLQMRPHDMARIGYLYLHEGRWDGRQVLPAAWVQASTRRQIAAGTLQDGYGYQWWVSDRGYYLALGYGGQFIFVLPEEDMVVVFTSELEEQDFYVPQVLLHEYILPAARSSGPLPENAAGLARLESASLALRIGQ